MFISLRINLVLLFSQYSVYITIFDCLVFVTVIVITHDGTQSGTMASNVEFGVRPLLMEPGTRQRHS